MISLAPSNYLLRHGKIWKDFGEYVPAEIAETEYAPIAAYNHRAMLKQARAQKEHPDKYAATMEKVCAINPDYYFELGKWYVSQQQLEKGAEAFQKGVDLGEDRVAVSNECDWLVDYYEDHGQPDRALAVASMAAEVYSRSGLEMFARLMEKRGQLKEAEAYYEKVDERYEGACEMRCFYFRHRAKDAEYEKRASESERQVFPNGLKKVAIADFTEPPKSGTKLIKSSALSMNAGVDIGSVIVALDSYLIENQAQYFYIRSLQLATDLKLIVWREGGYFEVNANPPRRTFGVEFEDVSQP
jgi:tetratricopeptide (TPR) repeat protein